MKIFSSDNDSPAFLGRDSNTDPLNDQKHRPTASYEQTVGKEGKKIPLAEHEFEDFVIDTEANPFGKLSQ